MTIAAVVVTYNRLSLLKECLEAISLQTCKVNSIIVVNNASTDGTTEYLQPYGLWMMTRFPKQTHWNTWFIY